VTQPPPHHEFAVAYPDLDGYTPDLHTDVTCHTAPFDSPQTDYERSAGGRGVHLAWFLWWRAGDAPCGGVPGRPTYPFRVENKRRVSPGRVLTFGEQNGVGLLLRSVWWRTFRGTGTQFRNVTERPHLAAGRAVSR